MDDMAAKISEILNDRESMAQIMQMAQSLGLSGNQDGQNTNQNNPPPNMNPNANNNYANTQTGNNVTNQNTSNTQSNQDYQSNQGNQNNNTSPGGQNNQDISATLAGIMNSLGGQNPNNGATSSQNQAPQFDVGTMMKIQKAMSAFSASNKNVELLKALKPHFGEDRQKKVDDAIKVMQLINMLPLLKESGLFGVLGNDKS